MGNQQRKTVNLVGSWMEVFVTLLRLNNICKFWSLSFEFLVLQKHIWTINYFVLRKYTRIVVRVKGLPLAIQQWLGRTADQWMVGHDFLACMFRNIESKDGFRFIVSFFFPFTLSSTSLVAQCICIMFHFVELYHRFVIEASWRSRSSLNYTVNPYQPW